MLLTMRFLAHSVLAAVLFALVERGRPQEALLYSPTIADPCDPRHSVLDAITHRFRSECGVRQWCKPTAPFDRDPLLALPVLSPIASWKREEAATVAAAVHPPTASIAPSTAASVGDFGLCMDKRCRRDEFPFGYKGVLFDALPPLCTADQFCPDDESECQPLIGLGKQCQLNRDGARWGACLWTLPLLTMLLPIQTPVSGLPQQRTARSAWLVCVDRQTQGPARHACWTRLPISATTKAGTK